MQVESSRQPRDCRIDPVLRKGRRTPKRQKLSANPFASLHPVWHGTSRNADPPSESSGPRRCAKESAFGWMPQCNAVAARGRAPSLASFDRHADRPAVGEDRCPRIEVLSHLFELVASEQMDILSIVAKLVADVALPARWILPPQNGDTSQNGLLQRLTPVQPRSR